MDSARRSRGTASEEDYEDGLYTEYSHNGDGEDGEDGEDEDEWCTYSYGIRRYLLDPHTPLHRFHLASFSDPLQYRRRVPGEMPPWRFLDGVESRQPLRRKPRDCRRRPRRRRSTTSTLLSKLSCPQSTSSTSTSVLVSMLPLAAASSDPPAREASSSFQATLPPPPPPPPENPGNPGNPESPENPESPAADVPTGPSRDDNRAVGPGDGPGIDRQGSGGDAEQQAAIWGHHHIIHDTGPFIIEGNDTDTSNSVDWDWEETGMENWTSEKLDAEFDAFERQIHAAE